MLSTLWTELCFECECWVSECWMLVSALFLTLHNSTVEYYLPGCFLDFYVSIMESMTVQNSSINLTVFKVCVKIRNPWQYSTVQYSTVLFTFLFLECYVSWYPWQYSTIYLMFSNCCVNIMVSMTVKFSTIYLTVFGVLCEHHWVCTSMNFFAVDHLKNYIKSELLL